MFVKKKLRREDFLFQDAWFETLTRRPGELHMQQFQISDCEQSKIYLFDAAACVYIDQCKYCTIFVGACEASIFVRDCQNLTVIGTTQQFRVRDCFQCQFWICCESQPIIESSHGITIGNFPLVGYSQLAEQMLQTRTNPWNNNWFDVYDFTPKKFMKQNYRLGEMSREQKERIAREIGGVVRELGIGECGGVVPRIRGKGRYTSGEVGVVVAYPVPESVASEEYELLQSRVHNMCEQEVKALSLEIECPSRIKVLFVKILRQDLSRWRKVLPNIVKQVSDQTSLQLYENTVFAPFKDEH